MVTNEELNERRESGCLLVLVDMKFFGVHPWFMKRTLRRHEWQTVGDTLMVPPTTYPMRWKNDVCVMRYLREETDIPLPEADNVFEDDGACYLQTKYVDGVSMETINDEELEIVAQELERHFETLKSIRAPQAGIIGQPLLCPPLWVSNASWKQNSCWRPKATAEPPGAEYVFCHNDLVKTNVIVDPESLEIVAIMNWEHGGFWPDFFELPFWRWSEELAVVDEGEAIVQTCRDWLVENCEEIVIEHLD